MILMKRRTVKSQKARKVCYHVQYKTVGSSLECFAFIKGSNNIACVVPSQAPKSAHIDRMAALRRTKEQHYSPPRCQQAHEFLPTTENPSPSQILRCFLHPTFSLLSNRLPNSNQTVTLNLNSCKTPNPPQLPPSAAVIENSFMATMMRPSVVTWSSSSGSPGTKIRIIWSVNGETVERNIILAAVEVTEEEDITSRIRDMVRFVIVRVLAVDW